MKTIYSSPLRVYLVLGMLALLGIYSGIQLPISLFPNSSKPEIWTGFRYGSSTPEEFLNTYGNQLESQLRSISTEQAKVERVEARYRDHGVQYMVRFEWGNSPTGSLRELENTIHSFGARLPEEIRDSNWIWLDNENSGFFAASFFSPERDLHEVYDIVEPMLAPKLTRIGEAQDPGIYNPSQKEIRVELNPEALASLQLFPRMVEQSIRAAVSSYSAGSITVGTSPLSIRMPRQASVLESLSQISIPTPSGRAVHLSEIGRIDFGPQTNARRMFKTNGASSIIVFATPKPGGNVKKMSEDVVAAIEETMPLLPKDIQYKVLVDPSVFIRASIQNVLHEVILAAAIAVAILFLFIGNVRNVVTASIEIPLSMVLAFILMRHFGMNLNLISLGGLALSAGMNVDASVVVMENIFRHFEKAPKKLSYSERLDIIIRAVKEVRFPVIAATISSLVVFLPLAFTSKLANAILGDLAKAVVFSHGFSAIVALILVPTIRLQLMSRGGETDSKSPIDSLLKKIESLYSLALGRFLSASVFKWATYGGLFVLLIALVTLILPRLPKEIVGRPDTDWINLNMNTKGNTMIRQMESQAELIERNATQELGKDVLYTFNIVKGANRATLMIRLRDKSRMQKVWEKLEARFTNTPLMRYSVAPFNPSELPIPDPPDFQVSFRGSDKKGRTKIAREVRDRLNESKIFPNLWTDPNINRDQAIHLHPHLEQWDAMAQKNIRFNPSDISDLVRVATDGRNAGRMPIDGELTNIQMVFPKPGVRTAEDIASLPVGVGEKIVPLRALATVSVDKISAATFRENGQGVVLINARKKKGDPTPTDELKEKAAATVKAWQQEQTEKGRKLPALLTIEDPHWELTDALDQLAVAVAISILLIFLTMIFQFGRVVPALIVLVSVPLGFIGVLVALFVFGSTLSLNSVLGVILLNGIAVANSIILVDFILKKVDSGLAPREAALSASRTRLRPILITSLTTVLGMLPIALGLGDGGKILQPLGITVSAGLWVSTLLTLFLVPTLQVSYLEWANTRAAKKVSPGLGQLQPEQTT